MSETEVLDFDSGVMQFINLLCIFSAQRPMRHVLSLWPKIWWSWFSMVHWNHQRFRYFASCTRLVVGMTLVKSAPASMPVLLVDSIPCLGRQGNVVGTFSPVSCVTGRYLDTF